MSERLASIKLASAQKRSDDEQERRLRRLRRRIWTTVERLEELKGRTSTAYGHRTLKAIDETMADLVRAYAAPLLPVWGPVVTTEVPLVHDLGDAEPAA